MQCGDEGTIVHACTKKNTRSQKEEMGCRARFGFGFRSKQAGRQAQVNIESTLQRGWRVR